MRRRSLLKVAVVVLTLCSAVALAKPNFSGDWKMNAAKSEFGAMPAPTKYEQKVTHSDPELKVAATWAGEFGEITLDLAYTTDGKECVNTSPMGQSKSILTWEGDTLVITTKMDFQGSEVTMTNKWTLSEDGKTLTVNGHFSGPQGEGDNKIVFEK